MGATTHSAASSAIGYQHQTWWGLAELLRSGPTRPDCAISLELYDDVAWDRSGSPTELLQVKHHQQTTRALTDAADDLWRTLKVWMDGAHPEEASGPELLLITTQFAAPDTAVAALRPDSRNDEFALTRLEQVAKSATAEGTRVAREQFLALSPAGRRTFISRVRVIDQSPHIHDVSAVVRASLQWALPTGHEDLFLAMIWRWWDEQALALLQGRLTSIDVGAAQAAIADIRDQFTRENLPTTVQLGDVDQHELTTKYRTHNFVQQMQWVAYPPRNLEKAIVDYYRAYLQTVRWLDEDLIGLSELSNFEDELVDEWEREFDWMLDLLDEDAEEIDKQKAGKEMLRQLLSQTGITVRARYNDPFFARGKRHELADKGKIGWHPDFEARLAELLQVGS
jgi:hypothetical protein